MSPSSLFPSRRACLLAMLATLAVTAVASAQAAPETSEAARAQAQRLVEEGTALHKKGDSAGALARFQSAYAVFPSPRLLFNIAQMFADLGNSADAADAFQQFLDAASADPKLANGESTAAATERLAQLQPNVGRVELAKTPSDARVEVDGRPRVLPTLYLAPGAHQLVVRREGFQSSTQFVAIAAGQSQSLAVNLVASGAPVDLAPKEAPGPAPMVAAAVAPANIPARIALGTAAVLAVGAAVMGGVALAQYGALPKHAGPPPASLPSAYASELTSARVSDVLWAGAAVAAGVGAGLWMFAAPTAGSGGELGVGGRF